MKHSKIISLLLALAMALSLAACGAPAEEPAEPAEPEVTEAPAEAEADAFPFTLVTKDGAEVTFTHVPETVLCMNVNTGDQLMALGLGDKIIATASNNARVAPEFREQYEAIPAMDPKPTLEVILDMDPDFVYGRSSAFTEKNNTEHATLESYGIMSLSSIEGYKLGADLEDVYQDFYNLGRIFQVEDRAEELVSGMKEKVAFVEAAIEGQETVKGFVFDDFNEDGAYTCGNNFTAMLMEHAGGVNIFKDMDTTWATVGWETVVERAPEVIIINDYGKHTVEEKIAVLKNDPALATIPAIQNDRIISVTLPESFASSMTANTVEKFARAFHPDCFEAEAEADAFPFTLTTFNDAQVTFDHVPETVVACNACTGDLLMALGLGDKIIGTAYNNAPVNAKWREEYEAIPVISELAIPLETMLALDPDMAFGRASAFSEKTNTTHDTLSEYGIMSLSSIESYQVGADIDSVYEDLYNLGRIFQVEDKAEEVVSAMKAKVADVEKAIEGQEPVKVFVYDMGQEGGAFTCGNNFTAKLIEHAGGVNVFADMDTIWATVSWEEIVKRAPEVIVINDYGSIPLEQKIAELKENPALSTIPAIQNDRIISITLIEVFASSMTADTVETFAHAFHPDCF